MLFVTVVLYASAGLVVCSVSIVDSNLQEQTLLKVAIKDLDPDVQESLSSSLSCGKIQKRKREREANPSEIPERDSYDRTETELE